jgi:hypothetical protein
MILVALIRKRESGRVATAIPAIAATQSKGVSITVARVATVAVANPTKTKTAPMTAEEEKAIRAWLKHIEETDPELISELVEKCRDDQEARWYFLKRSKKVHKQTTIIRPVYCGDCIHFDRINHPHLGHCLKGEPEAIAGLWNSDSRDCDVFRALNKTQEDHDGDS